jgi:hypothetical protein
MGKSGGIVRNFAEEHGWLAANMDASTVAGTGQPASGVLHVERVYLPRLSLVTNIVHVVTTAGATFSNANKLAIYSDDGLTKLAETADLAGVWNSTGSKTSPLTAPVTLPQGFYRVVFLSNATTPTTFRAGQATAATANAGLSAANSIGGTTGSGLTALPANFDPATLTVATPITVMLT